MATKIFRWIQSEDLLQDEVIQGDQEFLGGPILPAITTEAETLFMVLTQEPMEYEPWAMIDTMNHLPIY